MRTIYTEGTKCPDCGYGQNTSVTIPEQQDIDDEVARREAQVLAELPPGTVLTPFERASIKAAVKRETPNSNLVWSPAVEAQLREQQEETTSRCGIGVHCNDDGTCPGPVRPETGGIEARKGKAAEWSDQPWMVRAHENNVRARIGLTLKPEINVPANAGIERVQEFQALKAKRLTRTN